MRTSQPRHEEEEMHKLDVIRPVNKVRLLYAPRPIPPPNCCALQKWSVPPAPTIRVLTCL
jgi:hypothetical protein